MLTISNQPNFTGKAHLIGELSPAKKIQISKTLDALTLDKKSYDMYISNYKVKAQRAQDINNPCGPHFTTLMNPKKDSIVYAIQSTMENFENILNNLKY